MSHLTHAEVARLQCSDRLLGTALDIIRRELGHLCPLGSSLIDDVLPKAASELRRLNAIADQNKADCARLVAENRNLRVEVERLRFEAEQVRAAAIQ